MDLFYVKKHEKIFMRAFIIVVALIWIIPVYSALQKSLEIDGLSNYAYVLTQDMGGVSIFINFRNSFLIAIGHTVLVLLIGTIAAFSFSKIKFIGKEIIYNIVLMCLAIPGTVVLLPFFFTLKKIGIYDTLWGVILPEVTMTLPFAVLMLRNFFDSLPDSLMESALIDGANMPTIFSKIFLPLSQPALIGLGVLAIMWSLQDYLFPTMFITKKTLTTATVAIYSLKGFFGFTPLNLARYSAALVLLGVPAVLIFAFAQKFIINGIVSGSLKE